ncbi:MAG: helix-turn-helix domain-containing protein [Magnetococcus sp. YQC-5]
MSELLTVEEAAVYLHVKPGTLNNWRTSIRCCGPRYARIGKKILYDRVDLVRWVEERKKDPKEEGELRKIKKKERKGEDMRETLKLPRVRRDGGKIHSSD